MQDLHLQLKTLDYALYRKAIMYSETICIKLEDKIKENVNKHKLFADIERTIVGILLEQFERR
jgi:hypothetical protein